MGSVLRKNWFMLGLVGVAALAVADATTITVSVGLWLKAHHGPDIVIVFIFFLSGLALDMRQIRAGFADYRGTLAALAVMFIGAPLVALIFTAVPLPAGLMIGILLIAVMPTTLSSGVVMAGTAGGNMAHALLITIAANTIAVFTIPVTLGILLSLAGENRSIEIDQIPIMIKIAMLVLLPLLFGIISRNQAGQAMRRFLPYTGLCNQLGILAVVWMAACQGREAILSSMSSMVPVALTTFTFHLLLLVLGIATTRALNIGKGRREAVILMGGQKTLPLSIILQVSLFPEFGLALVVCVIHHIIHLTMDAVFVQYLQKMK